MCKHVIFKCLLSETALQIFTTFYIGPTVEGVSLNSSNPSASFNTVAAVPIYGKKSSPESRKLQALILHPMQNF